MKLNVTRQLLLYADVVNVYGESIYISNIKKNTKGLSGASKNTVLEVNVEKTKCMVMSREQQSEENYSIKVCNKSLDGVEHEEYCGTNGTKYINVREEIKIRLTTGNACYH